MEKTLLLYGNWRNDQYENGAYYQNDVKIECNFGEFTQVHNASIYQNAKVSKNGIQLYQGSIQIVGNDLKPVEGIWYISYLHTYARYAVKSSELRDNRIHIKNTVFEYTGSIKLEDFDFNMSIDGKGELIHNGYTYCGEFESVETIKECTLSRVMSNGQKVPFFYGEVKWLTMYAGIQIDERNISEGLFANNQLINGYVFDTAGYLKQIVGDPSGYEALYSERRYKYRELFQKNHRVVLHYPTTQPTTTMNQFTPNLGKPEIQLTSNLAKSTNPIIPNVGKSGSQSSPIMTNPGSQLTPSVATSKKTYTQEKKIANGSLVIYSEGGKCLVRMT